MEHSAELVYLMGNIVEIRLNPGPQQHLWTTPFWLHIRPSGPHDLWMDIHDQTFHDWFDLLKLVDRYRDDLINHPDRPCSWEECEAPEVLPRTLVDTTTQELARLLPSALRRLPTTSWGEHFGNFMAHVAQVPGIIERNPLFLWGNFHVRTLLFYSSSWTFPRRNISTGPHTRPSTPSFTIVRLFPSKGFLLTVSFDPGNMLGTQISFPAWDSTAVAVIRATAILKTIGSTKRLQID